MDNQNNGLQCPHCGQTIIDTAETKRMNSDQRRAYAVKNCNCPAAQEEKKAIANAEFAEFVYGPLLDFAKGNNLDHMAVWTPDGNKATVRLVNKMWTVDCNIRKVVE